MNKVTNIDTAQADSTGTDKVNGDKTQVEMAKLWSVEIKEISERTISRALRKIGFTRKKKLMVIKNEMTRPPYSR